MAQLDATYDEEHHGWGRGQKYPLAEPVEWSLRSARVRPKDARPLRRALDTLAAQEPLLDRVWGGMFQYSVGPGWDAPHYEKLVEVNAGALRAYAEVVQEHGSGESRRWTSAGNSIVEWFERFLATLAAGTGAAEESLPEFAAVENPFGPIEDVTLRRIASHSSGLMGEPPTATGLLVLGLTTALGMVADADEVVTEVEVELTADNGAVRQDRAVSFFRLRDGRIAYLREYWPESYTAPGWRAQWVERMDV